MTQVTIYHNPRCSKSRETLKLLTEQGIDPEIVDYLKTPLSKAALKDILSKLNITPRELLRTKEADYKTHQLNDESLSDTALIQAMIDFPKIMERPIVVKGKKAAIGRPPEAVLEIL